MQEAVDLRVHGRDDLLGPVAEVLAADAADEVEVLAAVETLDDGAVGAPVTTSFGLPAPRAT